MTISLINKFGTLLQQDISEIQSAAPLISESPASLRLGSHLEKLLLKISTEVEKYDKDVGDKLNLIRANESGQITVADLEEVLRVIRHAVGDEEKLKKVVKKLDRDGVCRAAFAPFYFQAA